MPISFYDILKITRSWLRSDFRAEMFPEKIKSYAGVKYCYLFNSGRTAQVFILKALSKLAGPSKNEVVIPAYTCFSVAAAIAKSGLKIRLVDVNPLTMDYDYEKLFGLNFTRVLTVIACNLFGILSAWEKLWSMALEKRVFLIDDAAQSMGTLFKGRPSGTLGDVGFYSLNRGKNLSTYAGGILLTDNDQIAARIQEDMRNLDRLDLSSEIEVLIKMTLYSWFLKPELYWLPNMIPFLGLGKTVFDETFSLGHLTNLQMCAGSILWDNLESLNTVRTKNARKLSEGLLKSGRFKIPGYDEGSCPAYLRLPLLAQDTAERDQAVTTLRLQGVVASTMYPSIIRQIPGIEKYLASPAKDFPRAQEVVEKLLTLPTHTYLRQNDIRKIISCLREI
jgi:dTDP-4-amino-4,6-dideoxygalactose transaminase